MKLTVQRRRLRIDAASDSGITELIGGGSPTVWNKSAVKFEAALYFNGNFVDDMSGLTSISLGIRDSQDRSKLIVPPQTVTAANFKTISEDNWLAGGEGDCQLSFSMTAAQMTFDLQGQSTNTFWLVMTALTTDGQAVCLGGTLLTVNDAGL